MQKGQVSEGTPILHEFDEDYSLDEIHMMNRTSRARGAVGAKAKVPRVVQQLAKPTHRILDFGAGHEAAQTQSLRSAGFQSVDAYDIGANQREGLHVANPQGGYDIVFASNVMNVQPDAERIIRVAQFCKGQLRKGGTFVCNFPKDPRKNNLKDRDFLALIQKVFRNVEVIDGCFVCR
jgi:hypothetical protein